jgi:hypothetical protein
MRILCGNPEYKTTREDIKRHFFSDFVAKGERARQDLSFTSRAISYLLWIKSLKEKI